MTGGRSAPWAPGNPDDNRWTCVIAIRDTDEEYDFMLKALPSAFKLGPTEMIIGLDEIDGKVSERLVSRIKDLLKEYHYENVRIVAVPKTKEWGFQLAHIFWNAYSQASYDKILSFDVDSILTKNVLHGLSQIGRDGVAVVSFTKRLRIKNLSDLVRYIFYRVRVRASDYVFSGIYWIWRPYFFDIVNLEKYKSIINGVDTFLTNELLAQGRYNIITRKEIGVKCMTPQNEDYPWRQFQVGVWIGANKEEWLRKRQERIEKRMASLKKRDGSKTLLSGTVRRAISAVIFAGVKLVYFRDYDTDKYLTTYVYLRSIMYQHPYLLKGFKFAVENPDSEIVRAAASMDDQEWYYAGSKYVNKMNWDFKGTGFVEST